MELCSYLLTSTTDMQWKDWMSVFSPFIAAIITIISVYISNKRLLNGQLKSQDRQLKHDREKNSQEIELKKRQIIYENIQKKNEILIEIKKSNMNELKENSASYLTHFYKLKECLGELCALTNFQFQPDINQKDRLEDYNKYLDKFTDYEFNLVQYSYKITLYLCNDYEVSKKLDDLITKSRFDVINVFNEIIDQKNFMHPDELKKFVSNFQHQIIKDLHDFSILFKEYQDLEASNIENMLAELNNKIEKSENIQI